MDPSGYGVNSTYTVGNGVENMEGKVCYVTDGKLSKIDPKVFWRSSPQCIYSMVLGFLTHGIYLWFFDPFSLLGFFTLFWREWG